jgi:hypothetical protein
LTAFDTVTPTGGASITLGLPPTHYLTAPAPLWAVQELNSFSEGIATLGTDGLTEDALIALISPP